MALVQMDRSDRLGWYVELAEVDNERAEGRGGAVQRPPLRSGIVILCVRWYLRYKMSLRDLVEMMAERGLSMAHTTIIRWVQRVFPREPVLPLTQERQAGIWHQLQG